MLAVVALTLAARLLAPPLPEASQPPAGPSSAAIPGSETPWTVTADMADWLHRRMPAGGWPLQRLEYLWRLMLHPEGLGLREVGGPSAPATEVFATRRADCVGFALLFVGFARELGLPAYFVVFEEVEGVRERSGLRLAVSHLAAGYGPPGRLTVFDFSGRSRPRRGLGRRVGDRRAAAILASNRGAEELLAGRSRAAAALFLAAVERDPSDARLWVNLGVALRREGRLEAAEAAYRRALEIDPALEAARLNLAALSLRDRPLAISRR